MNKCRVCLDLKNNLRSIFDIDYGISFADMLKSVARVKIESAHRDNICLQCCRKLRNLYNFKKEIERSDFKLNQQLNVFKFDNIEEVKGHLLVDIRDNKNITTYTDVDYISLLESDCGSILYRNTTITKTYSLKNPKENMPDMDFENKYYGTDIDYVDLYDGFIAHNCKPSRRQKIKLKERKGNKDEKKSIKQSSSLKKVCIKPVVLNNIRIIPSRRKPIKVNKDHKRRKRLDMCPYCGVMSSNMKSHIMVHIGEKKYKCSECSRAFFTRNLLSYHENTHLKAGAYKCDHCVAVFNSKMCLRSHMVLHTDDKNHICPICNKAFKRKDSLRRHKLIHNSSAKSIKCELCNMTFLHNQGLRHHMRVHTGERPFKCEICSQPYSYKHDFNRHCLKKHGVFLKHRSVHVMNEEVLMKEKTLMKDLMLRVQGVVKEGEPLNPFQGPSAALAFDAAIKALGT